MNQLLVIRILVCELEVREGGVCPEVGDEVGRQAQAPALHHHFTAGSSVNCAEHDHGVGPWEGGVVVCIGKLSREPAP